MYQRAVFPTNQFSMIICRNQLTGKWLAINECRDGGWWVPGGAVDSGETFSQVAHRQCMKEANVEVNLKGILSVDHYIDPTSNSE